MVPRGFTVLQSLSRPSHHPHHPCTPSSLRGIGIPTQSLTREKYWLRNEAQIPYSMSSVNRVYILGRHSGRRSWRPVGRRAMTPCSVSSRAANYSRNQNWIATILRGIAYHGLSLYRLTLPAAAGVAIAPAPSPEVFQLLCVIRLVHSNPARAELP